MNDFGKFLSALRKQKGMTQTELAELLGVTNQAVSKWETGDSFPETALLVPLADELGVTVDELLKGRRTAVPAPARTEEPSDACEEEIVPEGEKYAPEWWRTAMALLMGGGVALIIASVAAVVLCGVLDEERVLYGVIVMLAGIAVAVAIFISAGMTDAYYWMPVKDAGWKRRVREFTASIASGVTLCILSAAVFVAGGMAGDAGSEGGMAAAVACALGMIAAAVFLFIFSGMRWDRYYRSAAAEQYRREKKREHAGLSRFSGVVMIVSTIVFLLCGFLADAWHPAWVAFPVGGLICGILGAIDDASRKRK